MQYSYPCRIERDGDGWAASFPDVPEALTGGSDYEQTVELAADALVTALHRSYVERGRELPTPGTRSPGDVLIPLPAPVAESRRRTPRCIEARSPASSTDPGRT